MRELPGDLEANRWLVRKIAAEVTENNGRAQCRRPLIFSFRLDFDWLFLSRGRHLVLVRDGLPEGAGFGGQSPTSFRRLLRKWIVQDIQMAIRGRKFVGVGSDIREKGGRVLRRTGGRR